MSTPSWFPDERALAGPIHLDAATVAAYDAKAGFDPAEDVELLRTHGLGPSSTLVDLGAGTGALALAASRACVRVIAVDPSPAMATELRRRAAAAGVENVEVAEAGFLSYRHGGPPADAAYSRNALHHLPDLHKGAALARIAAWLRPGGTLLLHDLALACDPHELDEVVEPWLSAAPPDPRTGWTREEIEHDLRDEHVTYAWVLAALLERSGFDVVECRSAPSRSFVRYVCRRR
jgi:cyclopropane fatty-acyl-phospholipid synthase-like methyltransferase